MIKLLGDVPRKVTVALSGGIDSMVLLDFLSRKHNVDAAFFNHGTENSERAEVFVSHYCDTNKITLYKGKINNPDRKSGQSPEEHWREERYNFFRSFDVVVTAHHLDDVAETWIWSSLHGTSSLLPYRNGNVIRPLLLSRKTDLANWATQKNVPWVDDLSNDDTKYTRNYIRHELMPHALKVNPGIHSMLKKKLISRGVV